MGYLTIEKVQKNDGTKGQESMFLLDVERINQELLDMENHQSKITKKQQKELYQQMWIDYFLHAISV